MTKWHSFDSHNGKNATKRNPIHLTGTQDYHQNEPLDTMNSPLDEIQIGQFIIIWSRLFPHG